MARQASQAKLGFYPIAASGVDAILAHLALPQSGTKGIHILDPCAGEGKAINQLACGLNVPHQQVYAVELDANRVQRTKELMPDANVCGPASFLGTKITGYSFGLVYVNPPFDNELGGGRREEQAFVEEAYRVLVPGGTMVLVCPLSALNGNRGFCEYIDSRFEHMSMYSMPEKIRKFNEIVIIATKRRTLLSEEMMLKLGALHQSEFHYKTQINWWKLLAPVGGETCNQIINGSPYKTLPARVYHIQPGWKPHQFYKSVYLPEELVEALAKSPLNRLLDEVKPFALARPPLPPGKGHVALLLASGMLDGTVETEDGNHVVRGTAKKVEYYNAEASSSEENVDTGAVTTKDVYSQKVVLTIRAAWQDGTILTLSDQPEENEEEEKQNIDTPHRATGVEFCDKFMHRAAKVDGRCFQCEEESGLECQTSVTIGKHSTPPWS